MQQLFRYVFFFFIRCVFLAVIPETLHHFGCLVVSITVEWKPNSIMIFRDIGWYTVFLCIILCCIHFFWGVSNILFKHKCFLEQMTGYFCVVSKTLDEILFIDRLQQ